MKIYLMTDLEAVAGVMNFPDWCTPESRYYEQARTLLTRETNAAVDGFLSAGATEVVVADGHGHGAIDPMQLDGRVELIRGWPEGYPLHLDGSFDAIGWVGQHAMSRTVGAHLAHTGSFEAFECRINGRAVGEFGQMAMCAGEFGVRVIFFAGDRAGCEEAEALVPGVETVSVKRGLSEASGDELDGPAYMQANAAVATLMPERSRALIRAGAARAVTRAMSRDFGLVVLRPPFERVLTVRQTKTQPRRRSVATHPTSVAGVLNQPHAFEPVENEATGASR